MEQAQTTAAGSDERLAKLKQRYAPSATPREIAYAAFDKARAPSASTTRLSAAPRAGLEGTVDTASLYKEVAGIQLDLAELTEQYGKLNVTFSSLVGKDKYLTLGDFIKIVGYNIALQPKKARQVKIDAAGRKGETLVFLVSKMGEVLQEQLQRAIKGREYAHQVQGEAITHAKKMDRTLVERIANSYTGGADLEEATKELKKIESELGEFDSLLVSYESDVQNAKKVGDVEQVKRLTADMLEVLSMKEQVLDGRLSAEGVVSDIRRDILKSAEGIQSAKGAIAATRVNYKATNLWIDAMNELVFKYEHALHDFVPVFETQAKITAGGLEALAIKDALLRASEISQRLMDANEKLVKKLSAEVFELVKTPLLDPEKARAAEQRLKEYTDQLNEQKIKWAEAQQRVTEMPSQPHYAQHQ
ncbi:hypothetical protein HYZ97_04690 [Candidatus Pacearchaeota archaeon]|nr:hypothetical protein [Candidatus Pacearchaeota archaeon]